MDFEKIGGSSRSDIMTDARENWERACNTIYNNRENEFYEEIAICLVVAVGMAFFRRDLV